MDYHIPKGSVSCRESTIKKLGPVTGIDFTVVYNESVLWDQGSTEANNAAQKNFGVSFGLDNHWNSWRWTHSIGSISNKVLIGRDYRYHNGIRINKPFNLTENKIRFSNGFAEIYGTVRFNRTLNRIDLMVPQLKIVYQEPYNFTGVAVTCYQQFFYMEPRVPWDMLLTVNQIYLK